MEVLASKRRFVIVGASEDPAKYGNKVFNFLLKQGCKVIGINPKGGEINGVQLYKTLAEVPRDDAAAMTETVVVFIVPPKVTENAVKEAKALGYENMWMQPGSESDVAIQWCDANGVKLVHHDCIMVQYRR